MELGIGKEKVDTRHSGVCRLWIWQALKGGRQPAEGVSTEDKGL